MYGYHSHDGAKQLTYNGIDIFYMLIGPESRRLRNIIFQNIKFGKNNRQWGSTTVEIENFGPENSYQCYIKNYKADKIVFGKKVKCEFSRIIELQNIDIILQNGKFITYRYDDDGKIIDD